MQPAPQMPNANSSPDLIEWKKVFSEQMDIEGRAERRRNETVDILRRRKANYEYVKMCGSRYVHACGPLDCLAR